MFLMCHKDTVMCRLGWEDNMVYQTVLCVQMCVSISCMCGGAAVLGHR